MAQARTATATSTGELSEKSYISRVQDLLPSSISPTAPGDGTTSAILVEILRQSHASRTKVFYTNNRMKTKVGTPSDIVAFSAEDRESGRAAFCVIENISPSWIEELGSSWNLDPEFFVGHVTNPNTQDLSANHPAEYEVRDYRHLDGIFKYHKLRGQSDLHSLPNYFPRHCYEEQPHPVQSNTRISYYRVNQGLCKDVDRDIEDRD